MEKRTFYIWITKERLLLQLLTTKNESYLIANRGNGYDDIKRHFNRRNQRGQLLSCRTRLCRNQSNLAFPRAIIDTRGSSVEQSRSRSIFQRDRRISRARARARAGIARRGALPRENRTNGRRGRLIAPKRPDITVLPCAFNAGMRTHRADSTNSAGAHTHARRERASALRGALITNEIRAARSFAPLARCCCCTEALQVYVTR